MNNSSIPTIPPNTETTTCPLCGDTHDEVLALLVEDQDDLRRIPSGDLADEREYLQRELAAAKATEYSKSLAALNRHQLSVIDGELERRRRLEEWGGPKVAERGLVPGRVIEEIKRRTDLAGLISEDLAEPSYHGGKVWFHCRLHGRDSNPSLAVYEEDFRWWCFGCAQGGDIFDWLLVMRNMEWREAAEYLASRCGVELPKRGLPARQRREVARV